MFKITEAAAEQIRVAAKQGGTEGMPLRLAARQKEDGTFDYLMGFDDAKEEDLHISTEGVEVVISPEQIALLDEAVMDYVKLDTGELRFIFINPKDANYSPPSDH
ncbi:MAG TPA: iron-sulfur cluster assembly accessory protein [Sedimenticola sp.]|nr:iron-sulfur cluster assembly accessory protein [Sedimenticola sp.]